MHRENDRGHDNIGNKTKKMLRRLAISSKLILASLVRYLHIISMRSIDTGCSVYIWCHPVRNTRFRGSKYPISLQNRRLQKRTSFCPDSWWGLFHRMPFRVGCGRVVNECSAHVLILLLHDSCAPPPRRRPEAFVFLSSACFVFTTAVRPTKYTNGNAKSTKKKTSQKYCF